MTDPEKSESVPSPRGLSIRQKRALPLILTARTTTAGCKKAGVEPRTWRRWLEQEAFRDAVEAMLERASSEAAALLQAFLPEAVQAMNALTRDKNKGIRMQALMFMVNKGLQASGLFAIDKRIAKWEQERESR